ncbi:hypothetical protein [Alteribacillus sp. HJP-4]|uniref:hypothetical protein n=1 Tax=Alteribacillus sp. HJP-4 TaxID=2775394 RepID=UPI0035CCD65A
MAMTALTLFFICAVLSVIFLFMLIILWKQQKQNKYLQTILFVSTTALCGLSFAVFWVTAEDTGQHNAGGQSESFESIEEAVPAVLERENNLKEYDYGPPVIETKVFEEEGVIEASLTAKDNVTTDLIRSALLNSSADIFEDLLKSDEISTVKLHWYFPTEEDGEPERIVSLTGKGDSSRWRNVTEEEIIARTEDYWEHEKLG